MTFITTSPSETRKLAGKLLEDLPDRHLFTLYGDLGSGKTCFVQGIAAALGIEQPIASPTFKIVSEYQGRQRLCHIDLYRIPGPDSAVGLGLEEYIEQDGIVAIEWPERAEGLLPAEAVSIHFEPMEEMSHRRITVNC